MPISRLACRPILMSAILVTITPPAFAAPTLVARSDVDVIERGRVAHVEVRATDDGRPLAGRHVVSYVNGVRFGGVGVVDDAGRATIAVPIADAGESRIVVDLVPPFASRGDRKYYPNFEAIDAQSTTLSNALTIRATPPAPRGTLGPVTWDVMADTWVGVDGLGRALPTFDDVGGPRVNKTVGLFYYVWHEHFSRTVAAREHPIVRDSTKTIAANPDTPTFVADTYWWSEPLLGYYNSGEAYVLAKHARLLANAGVDTVIDDTSNNLAYLEQWLMQADVYRALRESGQRAPQVAHLCWSSTDKNAMAELMAGVYDAGIARDLWFEWKGKPLLLARADKIPEDSPIRDRFSLRTSWAWTNPKGWFGDGHDKWPWMAEVPASYGWHEDPTRPEQIAVTAGHHASTDKGKSFANGVQPPRDRERSGEGIQFAEQWAHALKVDPEFVFVTQWNEWTAGAFARKDDNGSFLGRPQKKGDLFFIDEYDAEFSRDTEPMRGGYGDNYYYQLVANIRRYKGVRPIEPVIAEPIAIDGAFDDWRAVAPEFRDAVGDETRRDAWGYGWLEHYLNATGRNDIVAAKVSYDAANAYFYVRTRDAITPASGDGWMELLLNPHARYDTGWLGYDLKVSVDAHGEASLKMNRDGRDDWNRDASLAPIAYRVVGNEMELAIPLKALTIEATPATIDFKWADNCRARGDWTDFSLNGDAAPDDRFNYRAILR